MAQSSSDRIEKHVVLKASRSRVWRALIDPKEFGEWFGVRLNGGFAPGERVRGVITHEGYEHLTWEIVVETVEPERRFSFRWHPYAVDSKLDYANEAPTLVAFELTDTGDGNTLLRVVESGFDGVPLSRRAKAFEMNEQGWAQQMQSIARHVDTTK